MADASTWNFGPSALRYEPPDLVIVTAKEGPQDHAGPFFKVLSELAANGPFYMIIDARGMSKMDNAARVNAARNLKVEWLRGVVYVGASLAVRVGVKGVSALLFVTGKASFPTEFVDSLDEARNVVARMRKEQA